MYRLLLPVLYFCTYPFLALKYKEGLEERKGRYPDDFTAPLKGRRPLWVHAVSVGEVQSASSFIHECADDGIPYPVILSTTTSTGREMSEKLLSGRIARHFYYPWDTPQIVKRAVNAIDPVAYVVMETEIWPDILYEMKSRGIPTFMVNGRFSDKSFEKSMCKAGFWREVLNLFSIIMVREREDCDKLMELGIPDGKIVCTGDCKVDALINRADGLDLTYMKKTVGNSVPLILAGSTHPGEDEIVLEAFDIFSRKYHKARLALVPRHPERAGAVFEIAKRHGETAFFSKLSGNEKWRILIVDKIGSLFDMYGLADAAFVGGSLVPKGGQNLMEPAIFGVPVTHGPYMKDFREASSKLGELEVAREVSDASDLAGKWIEDVDPVRRMKVAENSRIFFEEHRGASVKSWQLIKQFIADNER